MKKITSTLLIIILNIQLLFGVSSIDFYNIDSSVVVVATGDYVGGVIGLGPTFSEINNISVTGPVTGNDVVGGIIGDLPASSFVKDIHSTGDVIGNNIVGGVFGSMGNYGTGAFINETYFTGDVTAEGNKVGGLIGEQYYSTIINSYTITNVIGNDMVGGLIGNSYGGSVNISYSKGTVTGNNSVGGLIGEITSTHVNNSYSLSIVIGSNGVGGLAGLQLEGGKGSGTSISNSFSAGSVTGDNDVGGLVGRSGKEWNHMLPLPITSSFTVSDVSGANVVGGLVGNISSDTIVTNLWWNNNSNNPNVGIESNINNMEINITQDDLEYYYLNTNQPISMWDTNIWNFTGTDLPTFK